MRERPQTQFLLGNLPQTGEPVWFDDQEEHDQRTEYRDLDVRHGSAGKGQVEQVGDKRQCHIEKDGQEQDEGRAEKLPMIDPTPPMIIMNRILNDMSSEKPSGSTEPR